MTRRPDAAAMPERCEAVTKSGEPCRNRAAAGERRCVFHLPQSHPLRQQAAAAGGRGKSNVARARRRIEAEGVMQLADVRRLLGASMVGTLSGHVAPGVGSALASQARAFVAILEADELESRIRALEQAVATAEGGKR